MPSHERVLTLKLLNRAVLARQMLLDRAAFTVPNAIERLGGLQSQVPNPPYIGLWSRLKGFERDQLTQAMNDRQVVRVPYLRSTLHLITAADHGRFRRVIEPALVRGLNSFFGPKAKTLNVNAVIEDTRAYVEVSPRAMGEIRDYLAARMPDQDREALGYAARTYVPLVQVPPGGTWGAGSMAGYTTAEKWLDGRQAPPLDLPAFFLRYLAGYGPASVMDFQTWTGMTNLKGALETVCGTLVTYQDENGRMLYDLPDIALPDADTPAPPRFLPEYDNLLIAHADRSRIIADADRKKVFLSAGRILGTILVDGFVGGTWKIAKARRSAALVISPFAKLTDTHRDALITEGNHLLRFVEDKAADYAVRFADA